MPTSYVAEFVRDYGIHFTLVELLAQVICQKYAATARIGIS